MPTVGQSWQRAFPAEAVQAHAARAWVSARVKRWDASPVAGELFVAALATRPAVVQMTLSTAGPRIRITASSDRALPLHALRGTGRLIIDGLSLCHGVAHDHRGIWAELPWEAQ